MKKILIDATGSTGWIGGVYYKKNILFSMLQNKWIRGNCHIIVVTNHEFRGIFSIFEENEEYSNIVSIHSISKSGMRETKIKIALFLFLYRCDYMFPTIDPRICTRLHIKGINWIADYQHYHYPDFFTESDLEDRRRADTMTIDTGYPLILSSRACLNDFREYVSKTKENVYVVPFVSYIEKEVRELSDDSVLKACGKFGVTPRGYVMIANQFWQHKNHALVFEAIRLINGDDRLNMDKPIFVFTGEISDYRSDEYADRIRAYLAMPDIKGSCICTGFIDRSEQLALMRGARFLIQPSLFEGWGTVLEDAKVLDKRVLLSDIPVHREQMSEECVLFDPHDADGLAHLIVDNWEKNDPNFDNVDYGIENMYLDAAKYSEELERMLRSMQTQ